MLNSLHAFVFLIISNINFCVSSLRDGLSIYPTAQKTNVFPRNLQLLEDCLITFVDCEVPNQFDNLKSNTIDVLCNYEILPEDGKYEVAIYSTDANGDCVLGYNELAPHYISVAEPDGKGDNGEFSVKLNVNRDKIAWDMSEEGIPHPTQFEFESCIRVDIIGKDSNNADVQLAPSLTKLNVDLSFDGNFDVDVQLDTNIAVNEYSVAKKYSVSAYLCEKDPPHNRIDPTTKMFGPADIIRVCVITDDDDTYLQNILEYELAQYDGVGNQKNQFTHVKDGYISDLAGYDCTKTKPGSSVPGSMCLIETKTASIFYIYPILGIVAEGTADIRLIEHEARKLQSDFTIFEEGIVTDGSYATKALLSRDVDLFDESSASVCITKLSLFLSFFTITLVLSI